MNKMISRALDMVTKINKLSLEKALCDIFYKTVEKTSLISKK